MKRTKTKKLPKFTDEFGLIDPPISKAVYIGIDNGVSGTIGIISETGTLFFKTPTFSEQNYTKKKGNVTRIDSIKLTALLREATITTPEVHCMIERPMVNPTRYAATLSAIRALEATLTVVEQLGFAYSYIDSKEWQKALLPQGAKGADLKSASADIGCRLFPQHKELIKKHKDADGILMAEYCRRFYKS